MGFFFDFIFTFPRKDYLNEIIKRLDKIEIKVVDKKLKYRKRIVLEDKKIKIRERFEQAEEKLEETLIQVGLRIAKRGEGALFVVGDVKYKAFAPNSLKISLWV